jgi:uncharacterized protein (DUF58 family)
MVYNTRNADKVVIIILSVVIAALGIYLKSWWGLVVILSFLTAFISFYLFYKNLGLNTRTTKSVQ